MLSLPRNLTIVPGRVTGDPGHAHCMLHMPSPMLHASYPNPTQMLLHADEPRCLRRRHLDVGLLTVTPLYALAKSNCPS